MRVDRIAEQMARRGLSQRALAEAAGVSPAAIQQLLNGKTKRSRALPEIAAALDVSVDFLLGNSDELGPNLLVLDPVPSDTNLVSIEMARSFSRFDLNHEKTELFKVFFSESWIKIVAGDRDPAFLNLFELSSAEMAPNFMPGDILLLLRSERYDGDPSGIWLLGVDDSGLFRRVQRIDETTFRLSADNPAFSELIVRSDQLTLFGRVIWQGRSWHA